jgi:hypothetical protein
MIDDASRIDDVTIAIDANSNKLDKQVLDPQCCVCHLVGVVVEPSFYLCHVVSYRFVHTLRLCPPTCTWLTHLQALHSCLHRCSVRRDSLAPPLFFRFFPHHPTKKIWALLSSRRSCFTPAHLLRLARPYVIVPGSKHHTPSNTSTLWSVCWKRPDSYPRPLILRLRPGCSALLFACCCHDWASDE